MVIVGGWFEVAPDQREAFLAQQVEGIKASRAEPGNIEYAITADPVEPGRVVLFERWESQEALDVHLGVLASKRGNAPDPDAIAPTALSIVVYSVSGEKRLA
jgi:quinol monooxygenase YgiN